MRKVSKFWRIMLTIFVIALAFGTLFSCDDKKTSDNDQKGKMEGRVPVYQGMTIDNENPNINKVSSTNFDFRIAPLAYKGSEIVYVSATDVPNNPHSMRILQTLPDTPKVTSKVRQIRKSMKNNLSEKKPLPWKRKPKAL